MEVDILRGDTLSILQDIHPSLVYISQTNHPFQIEMIASIRKVLAVTLVADEPFVKVDKPMEAKRFFQYWSKAEKKAFLHDGGVNA